MHCGILFSFLLTLTIYFHVVLRASEVSAGGSSNIMEPMKLLRLLI